MSTTADRDAPAGLRPATMKDVAALAGVGIKTVSRVVNGEAGVSAETQERVQRAIDRLDYQRDLNASLLRRTERKTATIGLLLEDVANPFSSALNRAVEEAARERGVMVFTGSCDEDPERERDFVAMMRERRVDGVIVVPVAGADHGYLRAEQKVGTPFVFVDRPPNFLDADCVVSDNVGGARQAVQHMIARGHRRIACLGDDQAISTASERLQGYREALRDAGIRFDRRLVRMGLRSDDDAARAATALLAAAEPPTAVFAAQNLITVGCIRALRAAGAHRSVALVGFDEVPLADLLEPAITVVAQDARGLGTSAARLLFRRLDGDEAPSERVVVDVRLIERGSGEIPPPGGGRR